MVEQFPRTTESSSPITPWITRETQHQERYVSQNVQERSIRKDIVCQKSQPLGERLPRQQLKFLPERLDVFSGVNPFRIN